jgi:hypothetical protein
MIGMRPLLLVLALMLTIGLGVFLMRNHHGTIAKSAISTFPSHTWAPNFETQIKPIFQARCQPCHFQGGQVYDKMPFDKPETITRLGTKLFTRIKDEKEQKLIREFLDGANSESKDR